MKKFVLFGLIFVASSSYSHADMFSGFRDGMQKWKEIQREFNFQLKVKSLGVIPVVEVQANSQ